MKIRVLKLNSYEGVIKVGEIYDAAVAKNESQCAFYAGENGDQFVCLGGRYWGEEEAEFEIVKEEVQAPEIPNQDSSVRDEN